MKKMPRVYIIAGANGSGKTTFAKKFLPKYGQCDEFVNADLIAAGLAPLKPEKAAYAAGRLLLERLQLLARSKRNFAFETTLSGKSYAPFIRKLKKQGYEIIFFYLWIPDASLALKRIQERVALGGHDVPAAIVTRRFSRSLTNLFSLYWKLAHQIFLFDNSTLKPRLIAMQDHAQLKVYYNSLFKKINKEKN